METPSAQDFFFAWQGCCGRELHLLNTTIIPAGAPEGQYWVLDIDEQLARAFHTAGIENGNCNFSKYPVSHVGHEATARAMAEAFGSAVKMDRAPWDGKGLGLVLQLKGRPLEGKILNLEEMREFGIGWRLIFSAAYFKEIIQERKAQKE